MTNADLAERIHLSPSACLRRVRRLEDEGASDGYVVLVNQAAVDRPTIIFAEIALNRQSEETLAAFETTVGDSLDVIECYLMSGEADYPLRVVAADTADYERVHKILGRLPGLARTRSNFVLRTVGQKTAHEL